MKFYGASIWSYVSSKKCLKSLSLNFINTFEDGTKLKIPSEIKPLLQYLIIYLFFSFFLQGLKGAVSVRMKFYGVSICFVNTHLCAHDHLLPVRIKEYNTIIETHNYSEEDTPKILYHE